jgi:hypothetical protein
MRALIELATGDRGEATADLHRALDALGIAAPISEDERAHRRRRPPRR